MDIDSTGTHRMDILMANNYTLILGPSWGLVLFPCPRSFTNAGTSAWIDVVIPGPDAPVVHEIRVALDPQTLVTTYYKTNSDQWLKLTGLVRNWLQHRRPHDQWDWSSVWNMGVKDVKVVPCGTTRYPCVHITVTPQAAEIVWDDVGTLTLTSDTLCLARQRSTRYFLLPEASHGLG